MSYEGLLFSLRNLYPKGRGGAAPSLRGLIGREYKVPVNEPDEEAPHRSANGQRASSFLMAIKYRDRNGILSFRRITVQRVSLIEGDLYIEAYCHERKAPRHFKASRIVEIVDVETGEIFEDPVQYIRNNITLDLEGGRVREVATRRTLRDLQGEIAALVYLARTDGDFHERELFAISDYIERRATPRELDNIVVLKHLARKYPDYVSCMHGLDAVASRAEEIAQDFADAVVEVINADGDVLPEEEEFIVGLVEIFQEHGISVDAEWG